MQASIVLHLQASLDIYIYSLIASTQVCNLIYSLLENERKEKKEKKADQLRKHVVDK